MFLTKINSQKKSELNVLLYSTDIFNREPFMNMVQKLGIKNTIHSTDFSEIEVKLLNDEIDILFIEIDVFDIENQKILLNYQNNKTIRNVPKILVTSDYDYKTHIYAMELGIESVLIKPFNFDTIKQIFVSLYDKYDSSKNWYILNSIKKLIDDNELQMAGKFIAQIDNKITDFYLKYLKALYYYKNKQFKQAITELTLLCLFKPNMIESYKLLADCYKELQNEEKYLENLEKIIELSPKNPNHNLDIGKAYVEVDNLVKAEKHLKYAENINPKMGDLNKVLGTLYVKKGDIQKAEKYFLKADKNAEKFSIIELNEIGLNYQKQKKYEKALQYFNKALDLSYEKKGESEKFLYNIATVYFESGDFNKATYFANKALEVKQGFKEAQKLLTKIITETILKKNE